MRLLIKLGGTLLDGPESRHRLAREISHLQELGHQVVVVHGGGKQMTAFLAERGVESRFVNGLRVTSPEIIDAVVKVFAGSVNAHLVCAFRAAGALPVGLSGISGGLVDAVQLDPELGMVGKPVASNPKLLNLLTEGGFIPVVACLAGDETGNIFNVNADQLAVACAASFKADQLLFITDVDGVRGENGLVQTTLTEAQANACIESGVATGGMRAKLEASLDALHRGISEVRIAPGARIGVVEQLLHDPTPPGTRIVLSPVD